MAGEQLHFLDLRLCDHVRANIAQYFDDPGFAAWVLDGLPPGLTDYLRADPDRLEDEDLILDDVQLRTLISQLDRMSPDLDCTFDRFWVSWDLIYHLHADCLPEIHDKLSTHLAHEWSRACGSYAGNLRAERLRLPRAIEFVQEWLRHLRRLLRAMKATEFLPPPDGHASTPTLKASKPIVVQSNINSAFPPEELARGVERMRSILRTDPALSTGKPDNLIKIAKIAKQTGRDTLRWLKWNGEYDGFSNDRPDRYLEKRTNYFLAPASKPSGTATSEEFKQPTKH